MITRSQFYKKLNNRFNSVYAKYILPRYSAKSLPVLPSEDYKNEYWIIPNRVLIKAPCITIDPPGCRDADDGFCLYISDNKLYLAIHIADPTCYLNQHSQIFGVICSNSITHYPSMVAPLHLMPENIVQKSSLSTNVQKGEIKKAISVITEIDIKTLDAIDPQLQFTNIRIFKNNKYTYENASKLIYDIPSVENIKSYDNKTTINVAYKISRVMKDKRKTVGKMIDNFRSNIRYVNGVPELYNDSENVKMMKEMIAEFAIFANSYVGEYLSQNEKVDKKSLGIYRVCDASELKVNATDAGDKVMDEIIKSKISAKYTKDEQSHDLVGSMKYTHFTSPIRRASDCICHFLIKYIHLKNINPDIRPPFTVKKLNELTLRIDSQTKKERKLKYLDVKFRTIQALSNIISKNIYACISFQFNSYTGSLLNITIKRINEFNVSISYTVKVENYPKRLLDYLHHCEKTNTLLSLPIHVVHVPRKFDDGTLPELNLFLKNLNI